MFVNRFFKIIRKPSLSWLLLQIKSVILILIISAFGALFLFSAQAVQAAGTRLDNVNLHDIAVIDQDGQKLNFYFLNY